MGELNVVVLYNSIVNKWSCKHNQLNGTSDIASTDHVFSSKFHLYGLFTLQGSKIELFDLYNYPFCETDFQKQIKMEVKRVTSSNVK